MIALVLLWSYAVGKKKLPYSCTREGDKLGCVHMIDAYVQKKCCPAGDIGYSEKLYLDIIFECRTCQELLEYVTHGCNLENIMDFHICPDHITKSSNRSFAWQRCACAEETWMRLSTN